MCMHCRLGGVVLVGAPALQMDIMDACADERWPSFVVVCTTIKLVIRIALLCSSSNCFCQILVLADVCVTLFNDH